MGPDVLEGIGDEEHHVPDFLLRKDENHFRAAAYMPPEGLEFLHQERPACALVVLGLLSEVSFLEDVGHHLVLPDLRVIHREFPGRHAEVLHQHRAEDLPWAEHVQVGQHLPQALPVDAVPVAVQEKHPVAQLAEAHSADKKMLEQVVEDVVGIKGRLRGAYLSPVKPEHLKVLVQTLGGELLEAPAVASECMGIDVAVDLHLDFVDFGGVVLSAVDVERVVDPACLCLKDVICLECIFRGDI